MSVMKDRSEKDYNICRICNYFSKPFKFLAQIFERIFVFAFGRPGAQKFNDILLSLVLRAKGYDNCCSYETTGEDIFLKLLLKQSPRYCIDVGANVGTYSRRLLEETEAVVLAFEPLPLAFDELKSLSLEYPDRLFPINKGLGDAEAVLNLRFGESNIALASFEPSAMNIAYVARFNNKIVECQITSLDNFAKEGGITFDFSAIDLLKIDTEGYEYKVLLGASSLISKNPPKIVQIEYNTHQMYTANTLHQFHKLLPNYRMFRLLPHGRGLTPIYANRPTDNIFTFCNIIFVRKDIVSEFYK